jgi:CRP-like cAMP-binding protein
VSSRADTCDLDLLAQVPLFSALTRHELAIVASAAKRIDHREGETVIAEGALGSRFFVIESGTADVVAHGEVGPTLGPGAYFGELSVIDGERRSASVVATSPLRTWSIADFNFRPLLVEHPTLALGLLTSLSRRLRLAEASPVS